MESRLFRLPEPGPELADARQVLAERLDDLRGLGILPAASEPGPVEGEGALVSLALSLTNLLEATQRRVIETSIQVLSLRELTARLLSLRTPEEVAETVTLYLHKAFDHERVLVGVYDRSREQLEGWIAVRNGGSHCRPFVLQGNWDGSLRRALAGGASVHAVHARRDLPFLLPDGLPPELHAFGPDELGPYAIYPLAGHGQKIRKVVGVLVVGRRRGSDIAAGLESGILESVVEAVGTAMENVILEEDVRREEAFRKDIMRSMGAGLVAVDLAGRVLTMNAAAERLTGYTLAEMRGRDTAALDPPGGSLHDLLRKTLRTRRGIRRVERAVRRADGSAFPAACGTTLLRNPVGEVYGAVAVFDDLTELKQMEERVRALDRLAALGRFTAGIAHEIRNPLTGISTGVQYLARTLEGDGGQRENLDFIQREIARLDRIVEDLFRVTHPHPLRKSPEAPAAVVRRAVRSLGTLPAEREVELEVDVPSDLPPVAVDPDQIQQVLLNLLKNAVEATPPGGRVRLTAYTGAGEEPAKMVFQVFDTGAGIAEDDLPRIFEPFFTKGKAGGTGLGLYVSHGIVERHGGELHAARAHGGGAVFTVKLPMDSLDVTETSA